MNATRTIAAAVVLTIAAMFAAPAVAAADESFTVVETVPAVPRANQPSCEEQAQQITRMYLALEADMKDASRDALRHVQAQDQIIASQAAGIEQRDVVIAGQVEKLDRRRDRVQKLRGRIAELRAQLRAAR